MVYDILTRWKKNETEFSVKLSFDGRNSMSCRIPKPILEMLGEPESITFRIKNNRIVVD